MTENAISGTYLYALKLVWWVVKNPVYCTLAVILAFVLLGYIVRGYRLRISKKKLKRMVPVALVDLSPFLWFLVVKNHTIVHPHLEFRGLAVTVWAGLIVVAGMMEKKDMTSG